MKLGTWEPINAIGAANRRMFTFSMHGFQKLLGFFGGMGGHGATAPRLLTPVDSRGTRTFGGLLLMMGTLYPSRSSCAGRRDGGRVLPCASAARVVAHSERR